MELEPLFTEQRWKILQNLSDKKLSPLQLADMTSTTISNVSQQLKLLEAADIIKKEKVRNRDRGKPRTLFSLSDDYAYITLLMDGFAEKKLFSIKNNRKMLLKIWFLVDEELQKKLEKFCNEFQNHIGKLDAIFLNASRGEILVVSESFSKELLAGFDKFRQVKVKTANSSEAVSYLRHAKESKERIIALHETHDEAYAEGRESVQAVSS